MKRKISAGILAISLISFNLIAPSASTAAPPLSQYVQVDCPFAGKVQSSQAYVLNLHNGCHSIRAGMRYISPTGRVTDTWSTFAQNVATTNVWSGLSRVYYKGQGSRLTVFYTAVKYYHA